MKYYWQGQVLKISQNPARAPMSEVVFNKVACLQLKTQVDFT